MGRILFSPLDSMLLECVKVPIGDMNVDVKNVVSVGVVSESTSILFILMGSCVLVHTKFS